MEHLIESCPNIEQLNIGCLQFISKAETAHFFTSIRFKQLKWLSISAEMLFDGSYLPLVRT